MENMELCLFIYLYIAVSGEKFQIQVEDTYPQSVTNIIGLFFNDLFRLREKQ